MTEDLNTYNEMYDTSVTIKGDDIVGDQALPEEQEQLKRESLERLARIEKEKQLEAAHEEAAEFAGANMVEDKSLDEDKQKSDRTSVESVMGGLNIIEEGVGATVEAAADTVKGAAESIADMRLRMDEKSKSLEAGREGASPVIAEPFRDGSITKEDDVAIPATMNQEINKNGPDNGLSL